MWSFETDGLSWQWSLKTGFTVFDMVHVIVILILIIVCNLKIQHFMFNIYHVYKGCQMHGTKLNRTK